MDTPDFFVGARLGAARAKAGISLEQAARDTRIRVQKLREIEADDFSGFAHPTYARLFLLDYAEYLGVPADEIRPLLPDRAGPAAGGFQYIDVLAADVPAMHARLKNKRLRIVSLLATIFGVLFVIAAGLFTYFTVKKIERVARSKPLVELEAPAVSPTPAPESPADAQAEPAPSTAETEPSATPVPEPEPTQAPSPDAAPATPTP